jgi:hypothetical protein
VLPGFESTHDLLGGWSVTDRAVACVAAVELLTDIELRERCAVDGEVVGEAERERGEVLFWLTGRGRRSRSSLALLAATASVLERPRAIGAWGDRSVRSSAVVSHHRHPTWELYHDHLALDCAGDG